MLTNNEHSESPFSLIAILAVGVGEKNQTGYMGIHTGGTMASELKVVLQADIQPALNCLQSIKADLSDLEGFVEAPLKVLERLIDTGQPLFEFRCIDVDVGSTGASNLCVRVEPGDSLCVFAAALRAGDFDGLVTES
ncbi:hypothetical protein [Microbulbifer sp. ARAS458-1]|uniref:hypothetical protein n=1 Tax=Microbulbifer sp. ARAS458-1 TaxID=3140242 RepID=UPI003877ECF6